MIVVKISGGLGNQMFQYAFGRQLQEMYHMPLVLETFRYDDVFSGKLGSRLFPIDTEQGETCYCSVFAFPLQIMRKKQIPAECRRAQKMRCCSPPPW